MSTTFTFLLMIFCHIVDDYYLQGWLASAKQKKWWQKEAPAKLYRFDYIWALLMHSFSWAFMVMLPIAFYYNFDAGSCYVYILIINMITHAIVDNEKANNFTINLWVDQLIHMAQLILTAMIFL